MNNLAEELPDPLQLAQEIIQSSDDESKAKKLFYSNLLVMMTDYSSSSGKERLAAARLYAEMKGWVKTQDGGLA